MIYDSLLTTNSFPQNHKSSNVPITGCHVSSLSHQYLSVHQLWTALSIQYSVNVTYLQMCSLHAEYFLSVLLSVQVSLHNKLYLCVFRFQSPLLYFSVFLPITLSFMAYLAYLSSVFLSYFRLIYQRSKPL